MEPSQPDQVDVAVVDPDELDHRAVTLRPEVEEEALVHVVQEVVHDRHDRSADRRREPRRRGKPEVRKPLVDEFDGFLAGLARTDLPVGDEERDLAVDPAGSDQQPVADPVQLDRSDGPLDSAGQHEFGRRAVELGQDVRDVAHVGASTTGPSPSTSHSSRRTTHLGVSGASGNGAIS